MAEDIIFEVQIQFDKFDMTIQDLTSYSFYKYYSQKYNDFIRWALNKLHENSRGLEKVEKLEFVDKDCRGQVIITRKKSPEKLRMKVVLKAEGNEYVMKYTHDIPWVFLEYAKFDMPMGVFKKLVETACEAYTTIVFQGGETLTT